MGFTLKMTKRIGSNKTTLDLNALLELSSNCSGITSVDKTPLRSHWLVCRTYDKVYSLWLCPPESEQFVQVIMLRQYLKKLREADMLNQAVL